MSPSEKRRPKDWVVSRESFDRLLACLDSDRDRAALRYEVVRKKLSALFRWKGCRHPDELADQTLDRVARRLEEGTQLWVDDPYAYIHGVAIRVAQEHWRKPEREEPLAAPAHRELPAPPAEDETARRAEERRLDCLGRCLDRLSAEHRRLLETYHLEGDGPRIAARKALAARLGVPMNALRIRVHRIRAELSACLEECVGADRRNDSDPRDIPPGGSDRP
jgi:DNA-directed RNA polymerase specialized sigma24 family protein